MSVTEPIRIAWWPGGFSLPFTEVLRETAQCERFGLEPVFLPQSTPELALRAAEERRADVVIGASALHAMRSAGERGALRVVQGSQLGHACFLGRTGYEDFGSLRGARIGLAPPETTNHLLAAAMLERNHGLGPGSYTPRHGTEAELLEMLALGQVEAVSVRALTVPPERVLLSDFAREWKALTGLPSKPVLGVTAAATRFAAAHPQTLARFLDAMAATVAIGCDNAGLVARVLCDRLGIELSQARGIAAQWPHIYVARLDGGTIAALDALHALLSRAGSPGTEATCWWPEIADLANAGARIEEPSRDDDATHD